MRVLAPFALVFSSLVIVAPAAAQDTAPAAEKEQEAKKKPKKICRTVKATGSNLNKRKCRTAAQWNAESARANGMELDVVNDAAKTDYVAPM